MVRKNIILSEELCKKLDEIKKVYGSTHSAVIRLGIEKMYKDVIENKNN